MTTTTLSIEQKEAAVLQWADYMRAGGSAGDALTREMYEALNDNDVRDAFLFWQVGGNPSYIISGAPHRYETLTRLSALFGEPPGKAKATDSLAIALNRLPRADELVDAGTVLVLGSVLWDLIESRYSEAALVMTELIGLNLQFNSGRPAHYEPLHAFGEACKTLPKLDPRIAHETVTRIFGVDSSVE